MPQVFRKKSLSLLKKTFSYTEFRDGQAEIIQSIYEKNDTLVIMPTGGGKSLCYQVPALMSEGLCLVISPLIALMKDQVDQLQKRSVSAVAIHGNLERHELAEIYQNLEAYKLIYISPERLRNERFLRLLKSIQLSMIAVDEAHCISQWGHDFRPAYRNISDLKSIYPSVPIIALTATATDAVADDIEKNLKLRKANRFTKGFDRKNLKWVVLYDDDKLKKIREILNKVQGSILIYASTRKQVEEIYAYLSEKSDEKIDFYHAGLDKSKRVLVQDDFINNQIRVMICTNAFGMGIDKADVRCVIHYNITADLESYYQESGRAGRDGKRSFCILFYHYADVKTQEFFIQKELPKKHHLELVFECIKKNTDLRFSDIQRKTNVKEKAIESALDYLHRFSFISIEENGLINLKSKLRIEKQLRESQKQIDSSLKRLDSVIHYCEKRACRRNLILNYFGESHPNKDCGRCDICLGRNPRADLMDEKRVQVILNYIGKYDERFGLSSFVSAFKGEYSELVEKHKLYKSKGFALYKNESKKKIYDVLNQLILSGHLIKTTGRYPLLKRVKNRAK